MRFPKFFSIVRGPKAASRRACLRGEEEDDDEETLIFFLLSLATLLSLETITDPHFACARPL
jgi:hypothetical protein